MKCRSSDPSRTRVSEPDFSVRPMTGRDAATVLRIYQSGLDGGDASFETEAPRWQSWDERHLPDHRLVAVIATGELLGWVALGRVSDRRAYAGVGEVSVYVDAGRRRRGVARSLLRAAIRSSEEAGIWTLQAAVFPENEGSIRLFRSSGFRVVGRRERIGRHAGRWRDVLLLERRSEFVV